MKKLLNEIRKTNAAARELRNTQMQITQLLLLDEKLLEAELEQGLMDGIKLEDWCL